MILILDISSVAVELFGDEGFRTQHSFILFCFNDGPNSFPKLKKKKSINYYQIIQKVSKELYRKLYTEEENQNAFGVSQSIHSNKVQ